MLFQVLNREKFPPPMLRAGVQRLPPADPPTGRPFDSNQRGPIGNRSATRAVRDTPAASAVEPKIRRGSGTLQSPASICSKVCCAGRVPPSQCLLGFSQRQTYRFVKNAATPVFPSLRNCAGIADSGQSRSRSIGSFLRQNHYPPTADRERQQPPLGQQPALCWRRKWLLTCFLFFFPQHFQTANRTRKKEPRGVVANEPERLCDRPFLSLLDEPGRKKNPPIPVSFLKRFLKLNSEQSPYFCQ